MFLNCLFRLIKYLYVIIKEHFIGIAYSIIVIFSIWPTRFATHYKFIPASELDDILQRKTTLNISQQQLAQPPCTYLEILAENQFMYKISYRNDIIHSSEILSGGEYMPEECTPQFSTAIIVPYRQREKQLNSFLIYMHNYLRKQKIHYRIFIVEQFDQKPFNRAKLFNIGFEYARKLDFPCVVLHDVDLMPLHLGQLYACSQQPRHMCASLDEFRFNLPYSGLFGGAVAIESNVFSEINGMSNMFHGWGGEDDDLFGRLEAKQIKICRFPPKHSQYAMLLHPKEPKNKDRIIYLRTGPLRYHLDGLNSLVFAEKEYKLHNLFTHILVET